MATAQILHLFQDDTPRILRFPGFSWGSHRGVAFPKSDTRLDHESKLTGDAGPADA
jgi:hypothetical protein